MKKQYWIASIVGLLLVLMSFIVVLALDGIVVDWWVMSGGGVPSGGASITMNGTFGQPVVGQSSGGNVSVNSGYWATYEEYMLYLPVVMSNETP